MAPRQFENNFFFLKFFLFLHSEYRAHSVKVVDNLCAFLSRIDAGQVEAFSVLMKEWIDMGNIDAAIITVLFERFTKKLENTTENQAHLCLLILVMASR